jgi:RNA-directed DNA polymerase
MSKHRIKIKKGKRTNVRKRTMGFRRESFNPGYDLKACYQYVAHLQQEIALAKRENRTDVMNELVVTLTTSIEARIVAVHRIVTNTGYRSPGLSQGSFKTNVDYRNMVDTLEVIVNNPQSYKGTPLDRIYLPKPKGGLRPISIPSYLDRCLQALYKLAIEPISEEGADPSSYGFRPMRSIHWAAGRTLNCMNNAFANYNYVVEVDIKGCFDNISQEAILRISSVIPEHITKEWLNCGYIERENSEYFPTLQGVPQGGILSPTLANLVLDGLEESVKSGLQSAIKTKTKKGGALVRYADDMLYFTQTYEAAIVARDLIQQFLHTRGLSLNETKTKITDINHQTFRFVGFDFCRVYRLNRKKPTTYIKVPNGAILNLKNSLGSLKRSVGLLTRFVDKANSILRGWANNYRFCHNYLHIARSLGYWTWKLYYNKAYRFTKKSNDKWNHTKIHEHIMCSYFRPYLKMGYSAWPTPYDNKGKEHRLVDVREYHSQNPTFTNKAKNPFILADRLILEKVAIRHTFGVRAKVLEAYSNCCAKCGRNISLFSVPYELHHRQPRAYGGSNGPKNLIPLCREPCHMAISVAIQRRDIIAMESFINEGLLDLPSHITSSLFSQ